MIMILGFMHGCGLFYPTYIQSTLSTRKRDVYTYVIYMRFNRRTYAPLAKTLKHFYRIISSDDGI